MRQKRLLRLFASGTTAVLLAGCEGASPCEHLLGRRYESTSPGERGLGDDGRVTHGPWSLEFSHQTFERRAARDVWSWSFSDYGESGELECQGEELIFNDYDGAEKYRARHDPATDTILFEDVTYAFEKTR